MKNIKELVLVTVLTIGLLLAECATTHPIAWGEVKYIFFDRIGEMKLVSRENDLYIEKVDGSDKRKITSTSEIFERDAFFSKDGRYVLYETDESKYLMKGVADIKYSRFLQPVDENDSKKIEIDEFMYRDFKRERIKDKNNPE